MEMKKKLTIMKIKYFFPIEIFIVFCLKNESIVHLIAGEVNQKCQSEK